MIIIGKNPIVEAIRNKRNISKLVVSDSLRDQNFIKLLKDNRIKYEVLPQHVINKKYGDTFKVPEPLINEIGTKIMDLQEPTKKMDKSRGENKGCISMLDDLNVIKKKIKSAVTDNDASVHYDPVNKPGISNLMTIYSVITGLSFDDIKAKYEGKGYGDFKSDLAEIVANEVGMVQEKFNYWFNSEELDRVLNEGKMK